MNKKNQQDVLSADRFLRLVITCRSGLFAFLFLISASVTLSIAQENPFTSQPENARGSTTGPTKARGFSHPDQFLHMTPTKIADNMEPVILHDADIKQAQEKLNALEA